MIRDLRFVVPGRLDTPTGGYGYDRRIIAGLRALGWTVTVHELDDSFPFPSASARTEAAAVLGSIANDTLAIVDGLAFGALPREAACAAERLRLVALVHHPLAAETGLDAQVAAQLEQSERRALESARHVVVTSEATARMVAGYGVPRDRISVVTPGTDPAEQAHGSSEEPVHLLCVATLIPRKGHDVLFRALASLRDLSWRLTCVGSLHRHSQTAHQLRTLLEREQLVDRVLLAGERDGDALAMEYDGADVFVLPTLYEGYGMVVAEALARGLPVVATRTGAIAELVSEDAGVVVPPGDAEALAVALARVIGDRTFRKQLASGARRAGQRLPTWQRSSANMADLLTRVAG
jgi:glycosyltransferase involved in cell wall biosynthesis